MPTIWYKKQALGKWRRDDGIFKKLVTEESMIQEMIVLGKDGWKVIPHGITQIRSYEIIKESLN
jgi:hypothetical protein